MRVNRDPLALRCGHTLEGLSLSCERTPHRVGPHRANLTVIKKRSRRVWTVEWRVR